jgi:hypothetical protein
MHSAEHAFSEVGFVILCVQKLLASHKLLAYAASCTPKYEKVCECYMCAALGALKGMLTYKMFSRTKTGHVPMCTHCIYVYKANSSIYACTQLLGVLQCVGTRAQMEAQDGIVHK